MNVFMMQEKKFMIFLPMKQSLLLKVKHNQMSLKLMIVTKKTKMIIIILILFSNKILILCELSVDNSLFLL